MILLAVLLPPTALQILGNVVEEQTITTPYGDVGPLALRMPLDGPPVWIAPYTGLPDRTDPRATIFAARELGARRILGWEQGAGLSPTLEPGHSVVAEDYIDWTRRGPDTFVERRRTDFDADALARRPAFCPEMSQALHRTLPHATNGIYLATDGPRRETPAEARLYHRLGADVLGHNLVPEAALAQELGLCFAGLITLGARGADRTPSPRRNVVRGELHAILNALPGYLAGLRDAPTCSCAE